MSGDMLAKEPATLHNTTASMQPFINIVSYFKSMRDVGEILNILSTVRISSRLDEDAIHLVLKDIFDDHNISYEHEYRLFPRKRFDFWIDGIVIEVKKQKPNKIYLLNQLNRYTKDEHVKAVIVVLEKSMDLPKMLNDKPIFVKSLNTNWGLAV